MRFSDIAHLRLRNHSIAVRHAATSAQAVSRLVAMQAQDFLGVLWSLGLRLDGARHSDILAALNDGSVVRTWPMRGTLHVVAAADIRWLLNLLTPRVLALTARRERQLDLTPRTLAKSRELFVDALTEHHALTRQELYGVLTRGRISSSGQRGIYILAHLAQEGLICFGPPRGKQQTFVLMDAWVPASKPLVRDEALALLATRYFGGHGPATLRDFVWWSGLTVSDARQGIADAGTKITATVIEGETYWHGELPRVTKTAKPHVALLPGFDEYILGYTNRDAVLNPLHKKHIYSNLNLIFSPTMVLDGRVVGSWRRTVTSKKVRIAFTTFEKIPKTILPLFEKEAHRYGGFLGLPVELTLTSHS